MALTPVTSVNTVLPFITQYVATPALSVADVHESAAVFSVTVPTTNVADRAQVGAVRSAA